MKFFITLIAILGSLCPILSQNVTFSCSYTGTTEVITTLAFENDDLEDSYDAKGIVDRILGKYNIPSGNIIVQPSSQVNNANAAVKDGKPYILFSKYFVGTIQTKSEANWRLAGIFAHEVAHHVLFHTMGNNVSRRDLELQADKWAGAALYKLGASLAQAIVCVNETSLNGSTTHPPQVDRKQAIQNGWYEAQKQGGKVEPTPPNPINPTNLEFLHAAEGKKGAISLARSKGSKGKYAIINYSGVIVSDYVYDGIDSGSSYQSNGENVILGYVPISSYGKKGIVDIVSGNIILGCEWNEVWKSDINDPIVAVKDNKELWGFFNTNTHKLDILCQYVDYHVFTEGLAGVKKNGKWGFIDKNENIVIKLT